MGLPRACLVALLLSATTACGATDMPAPPPATTPSPTPTPAAWTLVWSDEFEGPAGATVDLKNWPWDVGGGGGGKQEHKSSGAGGRNVFLEGRGALVIGALGGP